MSERRPDIWIPAYLRDAPARAAARRRRAGMTTHILFLVCDHFEPRHGVTQEGQSAQRVETWHREYARLQSRCKERFGTVPLHSFFYPPHHGYEHLAPLAEMVFDGLAEVELHYHHDGDTEETLRAALAETVDEYARWGLLLESGETPRRSFGFIHGDWALNNSCGGRHCGVNDELTVLSEFGCWGDLTMPSGNVCQTRKINSIYYASSNPNKPKGHDRGIDARVGVANSLGMLMIQGPLAINWRAPDHPRIENASLTTRNWGRPDRIRQWLDCNIHVRGRPEWLFVKLHCHGAIEKDFDGLFGERAFEMHRLLNEHYNDGQRYRLHYVTARQAYNIVKAAEDGMTGDPDQWRDYRVKSPAHSLYFLGSRHRLVACSADRIAIDGVASDPDTRFRSRVGPLRGLRGPISAIEAERGVVRFCAPAGAEIEVDLAPSTGPVQAEGATYAAAPEGRGYLRTTSGDGWVRLTAVSVHPASQYQET